MHDKVKNVGEIIRTARDAKGITQAVLSKMTGISVRTIIDIEKEKHRPSFENIYQIINALDLPADYIFRPDRVCYTLEQEQVMQFIQSCDEQEQSVFMKIAWAYIEALNEKGAKNRRLLNRPLLLLCDFWT